MLSSERRTSVATRNVCVHRHGVLISPAHHFVVGEAAGPAAVRVSLGAVDRPVLERALHAMAGVLEMPTSASSSIV